MKKNYLKIFAFCFFLIAMLLFIFYSKKQTTQEKLISDISQSKLQQNTLEKKDIAKIENQNQNQIPKNIKPNLANLSSEEIEKNVEFIKSMKEHYTNLNFDAEFRENILSLYQKNPEILKFYQEILKDKNYARDMLLDDQSYARVFAIRALKEVAILGNSQPLVETTKLLSQTFEEKGSMDKGQEADLYDLIHAYISLQNLDEIDKNLANYLDKIGYSKNLKNQNIKDVYDQSIFFILKSKFGREKATEIMKNYFPES